MSTAKNKFQTVDEYISVFPEEIRGTMEKIRQTIKQAAPNAEEVISYQIPAFKYHGMMIYFAAYKKHYSLFIPHPLKIYEAFNEELSPYEIHKSNIKFPLDKPFPLDLLSKITKFRLKENLKKGRDKKK